MALSNLSGQIGTLRDPDGHFGNQSKSKATMADIYFTGTGDEAADRKIRRDLAAGKLQRVAQGVHIDPGTETVAGVILQIGRASCRDRVCQYVSISVVAGSLQKKR